jgi:hypothetical protein
MSNSNPLNLSKSTSGDYRIPIKAIFLEAWYRVKGMKAVFWGGFLYFILVMGAACVLMGLILALYDVFVLPLATAHSALSFYHLKLGLKFIVVGIVEMIRFLLTASLAYLALKHLRNEPIHARMAFSFRHAWRPLLWIALLLYLLNSFILSSASLLLHSAFQQPLFFLGPILGSIFSLLIFLICFFLYFYFSIIVFMTVLLILDQKLLIKQSLSLAFVSVNQHVFKNIFLIIMTSIVFGILVLITLGMGLIWLLPMTSLVTAIQYNQIFCEGNLV